MAEKNNILVVGTSGMAAKGSVWDITSGSHRLSVFLSTLFWKSSHISQMVQLLCLNRKHLATFMYHSSWKVSATMESKLQNSVFRFRQYVKL